jgi:hypothetical protein
VNIGKIGAQFDPFYNAIDDITHHATAAATGTQSALDKIKNLFDTGGLASDQSVKLTLDDSIQSAKDAIDAVNQPKADANGTSDKATQAAQAERDAQVALADAYHNVSDAQRGVRDASDNLAKSQQSLADAQRQLAEFDNPAAATIRRLERTQITNRAVVTPADVRQKHIDLFNFDQSNADKQISLTEGVSNAVDGVAKAQQGVQDAEQKVVDTTNKVGDAQRNVQKATEARKKVTEDALTSIEGLERKAQEAAIAAGTAFSAWADQTQPADDVLKSMLTTLQAIGLTAGDPELAKNLGNIAKAITDAQTAAAGGAFLKPNFTGPLTSGEQVLQFSAQGPNAGLVANIVAGKGPLTIDQLTAIIEGTFTGPLTKAQQDALHRLGVKGFALGGIVPGLLGQPRVIVAHGGEKVQTPAQQQPDSQPAQVITVAPVYNFHGGPPNPEDLEWTNRELGWRIARRGERA